MKRLLLAIMLMFIAVNADAANTLTTSGNWSTSSNLDGGTPTATSDDLETIKTNLEASISTLTTAIEAISK